MGFTIVACGVSEEIAFSNVPDDAVQLAYLSRIACLGEGFEKAAVTAVIATYEGEQGFLDVVCSKRRILDAGCLYIRI